MTENDATTAARDELRTDVTNGKFKSLAGVILESTGRLIRKISFSPEPPAFWYNALVFSLAVLLLCVLISLLFGGPFPAVTPEIRLSLTFVGLLGVVIGAAFVVATAVVHKNLLGTLSDTVLDAVTAAEDLNDLRGWLTATFSLKAQFLNSLVLTLIIFPLFNLLLTLLTGIYLGLAVYLVAIIAGFMGFLALPMVNTAFALPHRISRYRLKLFAADPGSSEVIDRLSDAINSVLLIMGVLLALFSGVLFLYTPTELFGLLVLPLPWGIVISIFISGQMALAKMINRAKWQTLKTIQAQIETLQAQDAILTEQTLTHINQLLDYHARIRKTRNSAIDIRAGLSLLQSLLLPLIGLILANLLDILKVVASLSEGN